LLCQGTEILEAAAFHDVLGWSGTYGSEPVQVVTASAHPRVECSFGLKVVADLRLSEVDPLQFDALAIPGGFERFGFYDEAYSPPVQSLIAQFAALSKPIAAICVGALPLAKTGVLNGKRATTYHLLEGKRRRQLAELGACVVDEPVVQDGSFITSTSPATAAEVALRLLGELTGQDNARRIRHLMGFGDAAA
jgi:4-methyl-5(b-hydroxyethyl)-thiazole monophosphate biosynthesis